MGQRYIVEGYTPNSEDNVYCSIIDQDMDAEYMFSDICSMIEEQCSSMSSEDAEAAALELIDELWSDASITDDLDVIACDYARPTKKHSGKPLIPPCCN